MSHLRAALSSAAIAAVLALGCGTWFAMAPAAERSKVLPKTMPEPNPRTVEIRRSNALMLQVLKDAAESKDNMARDLKGLLK